jgi:Tol biopolymer transport system component
VILSERGAILKTFMSAFPDRPWLVTHWGMISFGRDSIQQELTNFLPPHLQILTEIAFHTGSSLVSVYAGGRCQVMTIPAAGGQLRPVGTDGWAHIRQVVWLADSSGLALIALQSHNSSGQIWHLSYPAGKARRVTNDLNDYLDLSLATDSRTLFAVQGETNSNIWTLPGATAAHAVQVTSGVATQDGLFGLQWTKDGDMVYESLAGGTRQLWLQKPGGETRQITSDADLGFFSTPSICPEGRTIVYGAGRYGSASIWRVNADSEKLPEPLIPPGTNGAPSCSPDGKWVYYNALGKYYSLWRVPVTGGRPEQLTRSVGISVRFAGW